MEWLGLCFGLLWAGLMVGYIVHQGKNKKPLYMPVPLSRIERRAQSEQILEAVRLHTVRDVFLPIPMEFRAIFFEPGRGKAAESEIVTIHEDARVRLEDDGNGTMLFVVKDLPLDLEGIVAFETDVADVVNRLGGHYAGWWEWMGAPSGSDEEEEWDS